MRAPASAALLLLTACGPSVQDLLDAAREEALAPPPAAAAGWSPHAVADLSYPLLGEVVTAQDYGIPTAI